MLSRVNFILVFIFINRSVTYYISIVIFYFLSSLSLFCFICRIFIIILFLFIVIIALFYFILVCFHLLFFKAQAQVQGQDWGPILVLFGAHFVSNFKAKDRTKEEPNHQVQPTRPRRGPKKIHRPSACQTFPPQATPSAWPNLAWPPLMPLMHVQKPFLPFLFRLLFRALRMCDMPALQAVQTNRPYRRTYNRPHQPIPSVTSQVDPPSREVSRQFSYSTLAQPRPIPCSPGRTDSASAVTDLPSQLSSPSTPLHNLVIHQPLDQMTCHACSPHKPGLSVPRDHGTRISSRSSLLLDHVSRPIFAPACAPSCHHKLPNLHLPAYSWQKLFFFIPRAHLLSPTCQLAVISSREHHASWGRPLL